MTIRSAVLAGIAAVTVSAGAAGASSPAGSGTTSCPPVALASTSSYKADVLSFFRRLGVLPPL